MTRLILALLAVAGIACAVPAQAATMLSSPALTHAVSGAATVDVSWHHHHRHHHHHPRA